MKDILFNMLERAIKTAAQSILVIITVDNGVYNFSVGANALFIAALSGFIYSILTSIVSTPFINIAKKEHEQQDQQENK